jgi:hypothetical protein
MVKTVGGIFSLGGLAALIYFLIHYMHNSGSVSVAGAQVAQKSGSIWPIVISGIVMVIGIIILVSSRNS